MTSLIEKFIHSKLENIEITSDPNGDILGFKDNVKFNLYSVTYSLKKKSNNLLLKEAPKISPLKLN